MPTSIKEKFEIYLQYIFSFCLDQDGFEGIFIRKNHIYDYFRSGINRIHDEIKMKKLSLVSSSAWDAKFKVIIIR
jgi:hypothetical protein